ncbi:NERD domain-containing protein [Oscillochloris sp. ZM17-4]|uniref:nuclease-related domain-containing protein n=1 Tax=Oscillochloris sp. ZM17-4 TaxID=2866714 RepID=UPI001C736C00|nr:nuclease-related domain-containing protein [Oscillochloris sp. ZM17-4]MBX0330187.1 NERD domain-containing protein [Oscillochloris sp. ZM17-4]
MNADEQPQPDLLLQSAAARKAGDDAASCALLREYLLRERALLWLARQSASPAEALAAAELAYQLAPGDEVVQRAIIAVRERAGALPTPAQSQASLSGAVALSTGMTLGEASAVIWPFKGINRPIGDALDDGTIVLHDLAYGVEKARDRRVRDAARTILYSTIVGAEPERGARPLRVIKGGRYAERKERQALLFAGMIGAVGLMLWAGLMVASIVNLWLRSGWLISLLILVLFGVVIGLQRLLDRFVEESRSYRLGRWGEERAADSLRGLLSDEWTLVQNFSFPNRAWGDIDLLLVGPGGIWALEVKAYSGAIRNLGDTWERLHKGTWRRLQAHPGKQARRNAVNLKTYLDQQGVAVKWVEAVVVWAGDEDDGDETGSLSVKDPDTRVWRANSLAEDGEELFQPKHGLSPEQVEAALAVLRKAVDEARQAEYGQTKQG